MHLACVKLWGQREKQKKNIHCLYTVFHLSISLFLPITQLWIPLASDSSTRYYQRGIVAQRRDNMNCLWTSRLKP